MTSARSRLLVFGIGTVLAALAAAVLVARGEHPELVDTLLGRRDLGVPAAAQATLALQLAAIVAGIVAVHLVPAVWVRPVLLLQGAVCVLAQGASGVIGLVGLASWWGILEARVLGRARFVLAALILVAPIGLAWWWGGAVAHAAYVGSLTFTPRLVLYGYDRWQRDEPAPAADFFGYMLLAPLVILPPYMTIIPFFGSARATPRPELSGTRLLAVARHAGLAAVFGATAMAMSSLGLDPERGDFAALPVRLVGYVVVVATLAHGFFALLLLHGIDERPAIDRPLLATRVVELWHRMGVHQKDAQVFLFYTPALLRLRRRGRYVAIVGATLWTLVVGNTALHALVRYGFVADPVAALGWALAANAILGVALAIELCLDEWWRRRGGGPPATPLTRILGWTWTMAIAGTVVTL